MRTRDLLGLGLLLVGVRLLWVGELAPGEVEEAVAAHQRSQHGPPRPGRAGKRGSSRIHLPDEVSPARSRAKRAKPEVAQVEVMEEDEEAMQAADAIVVASQPRLRGQPHGEELAAGSWGEQRESRWKDLIRPDMEFLMTKQSIHSTSERAGPRSPAMVKFRLRDHKGSTRDVDWEADFTESARLPRQDWQWTSDEFSKAKGSRLRHRTCALVGNSGVLRHSGLGKEIDEHEAVMRINYAPTMGFEKDVGSQTAYDLVNKENCMKLAKGEYQWRRPKSTVFLFESHSRIIRSQVYAKLLQRAPVKSGDETVLVLQPALMTASRSIYLMIKAEAEDEINAARLAWGTTGELNSTKVHLMSSYMVNAIRRSGPLSPGARRKFEFNGKPMSGMGALFVCMQMCEKTTMYGFDSFLDKRKQRYHYFDDREGMTDVHSFDLAMEVFHRIGEVYPVTVRRVPT